MTSRGPLVRIIDLHHVQLRAGEHESMREGACVMELTALTAGEEWSDRPRCVSPVIAQFLRSWNDCLPDRPRQG